MNLSTLFEFCSFTIARQLGQKRNRRAAIIRRRLAVEPLETRTMLDAAPTTDYIAAPQAHGAADPVAHNENYQTYAGGTFVVGTEKGLLADDGGTGGAALMAVAVAQPEHGKLTLDANGSFTYLPDPGFHGHDDFKYRATDGQASSGLATVSLVVLPQSAMPKPHGTSSTRSTGGITPLDSTGPSPEDGAVVSVSDAEAKAGCSLTFQVTLSGVPATETDTQILDVFTTDGTAYAPGDYQAIADPTNYYLDGNASFPVAVQTYYNGPRGDGVTAITMGLSAARWAPYPDPGGWGTGTIDLTASPQSCSCSCSCGNVTPSADPLNGSPTVNSGQGGQPPDLKYVGADEPHPIVTVNDVLSANVADADYIQVQTALSDMSGDVLLTGPAVDYSPAGYTAGEEVQYSQQLDAAGFAAGSYQYTTTVSEIYSTAQLPAVVRTYSGFVDVQNRDNSRYGSGWTLNGLDSLTIEPTGVALSQADGNVLWFQAQQSPSGMGGPVYVTPIGDWGEMNLVQNGDGSYTLGFKDNSQELFSSAGVLTATIDQNGNETSYSFNSDGTLASMVNQSGQQTSFAYTNSLLTSATDFTGRVTSYGYTNGQLTSIALPDPGDGEEQHFTDMTYDPTTGLLSTITDSGGTTTLDYNVFRQATSITNPDGTTTSYVAADAQSLVDTSGGLGTPSDPAPLVYTANVVGSTTDGDGNTSTYTVDPSTGETISTTDATGDDTTTYEYDQTGQVTQMTQPPLTSGGAYLVTSFEYGANQNLIQETLPDGSSESWVYDTTWNEPTQFVDAAGRETDYALDPNNGDVLGVTQVGQNGDPDLVTSYTYTPNPTAQGQTPGGLVATMVDPRGIETEYFYNTAGLVTSIVCAAGTSDQASVSFSYDTNDNLASYTNELGLTTNYTFDNSNREVEEQDPPPNPDDPDVRPTWTWSYDVRSRVTEEVDPLGRTTVDTYFADSENPSTVTGPAPDGGTDDTVTTNSYDDDGNLVEVSDALSRDTFTTFDADDRPVSVTLPNPATGGSGGPTESVVYDALGFVVSETDLLGGETDDTVNWRGQTLTTTGPAPTPGAERPTETYTYNADAQVLTDENPLSATTQYVYDSFGWLTEEILPPPTSGASSVTLHWSYDDDGNVVSYTDGNGNKYTYVYNSRNEMVEEDGPSPDGGTTPGPVWQWVYDSAGGLVETIDPMSRVTQYVLDGDGNVIETIAPNLSTGGAGDASTTTYDTYDLDNELTSQTTPNGATTYYAYNGLGDMIQETQPAAGVGDTAPV